MFKNYDDLKSKLNTAFKALRTEFHFVARQSFYCCQDCAWASFDGKLDRPRTGRWGDRRGCRPGARRQRA